MAGTVLHTRWCSMALLLVVTYPVCRSFKVSDNMVVISKQKQQEMLDKAEAACLDRNSIEPPLDEKLFCNRTWDGLLCWPDTAAANVAAQRCPDYINLFNKKEYATKTCLPNGTWYYSPIYRRIWTNYTQCSLKALSPSSNINVSVLISEHLGNIKLMYSIGYGLSFVSLFLALVIMLYFKKLHCPRNTVHINLFMSFILRAGISFLMQTLLVKGVGLPMDVMYTPDGNLHFKEGGLHWECKLLFVVFNYALGANYMWIFVEGLYLHMLIFVSVFSEKSGIKWYIILGWSTPLIFVIPWAIVRALYQDYLCWNTHPTLAYFYIIKGPIIFTICINFLFFLNIVRVLFTKLKTSNTPEARKYRYRKLAKSTLVLIPLFGVHYMVFVGIPEDVGEHAQLVRFYFEMFFNSFQGFAVAMLFCFLNGEVQAEIRKKWKRYRLRHGGGSSFRGSGTRTTIMSMTTYMSKARDSIYSINSEKGDTEKLSNGHVIKTSKSPRTSPVRTKKQNGTNSVRFVEIPVNGATDEKEPIMPIADKESTLESTL